MNTWEEKRVKMGGVGTRIHGIRMCTVHTCSFGLTPILDFPLNLHNLGAFAIKAECAGWHFRVYALVWAFRNKLFASLVPSHWRKVGERDSCPSAHQCCLCPEASLPCRRRQCFTHSFPRQ